MNYNQWTGVGRLTADPAIKQTKGGSPYAGFNLAINDGWGEKKEVNFFHVQVWGKASDIVGKYVRKGDLLLVNGKLKQQKWTDRDGEKHERLIIIAWTVELQPKSWSGDRPQQQQQQPKEQKPYPEPNEESVGEFLDADGSRPF